MVSVASIANRERSDYVDEDAKYVGADGLLNDEGIRVQTNKISTILRIALANGHDAIVLGAFGCGVYHLDPEQIASMFKTVLDKDEFRGQFGKVAFAILERKRGEPIGKDGKYAPFYRIFGVDPL